MSLDVITKTQKDFKKERLQKKFVKCIKIFQKEKQKQKNGRERYRNLPED